MSTHTRMFRPSLVTALVKVAMIGTWRGRTILDDNLEFGDIADFVPDEPQAPLRLPVTAPVTAPAAPGPGVERPAAVAGHSVAA